ncbi:zf-TFIIB domain-containing protein [Ningiella sp. W23]|uniref:zf-TFIIB domain-containing protein n=1 Tax=Ningiella sp. W23 TaxID=3023715 RepID=UPI0037573B9C
MNVSQCSSCKHEIKGISRVCPMCNADVKLVLEDRERNCPRCRIALEIHPFNHHDIDTCAQCGGMWVEPETFRTLTTELDVYKDPKVNPNYERPGLPKGEGYLPCANCSELMVRQHFKGISGVMIDLCAYCGFWLDKDELAQIRDFIASGGLDRAQDKKFERHARTTAHEIDKLNKCVTDLEFMDKMMNRFDSKWWFYKIGR